MARHKDMRHTAYKIAAQMRADILGGELRPGSKLPSIGQLAEDHGVAASTMQRALAILKSEALLTSQTGVAVRVRDRDVQTIVPAEYMTPSALGEPYAWITQAARRGQTGANQIVKVTTGPAPWRVARAFGWTTDEDAANGGTAVDTTVVARHRIGLLDGEPAEYAVSYYPAEWAAGTPLAARRKIRGGSPTLLAQMGKPLRGQYAELIPRQATTEEYELLELPGDPPVMEVFVVAYTDNREPVEVTVLVKPGYSFRMGFEVPAQPLESTT